MQKGAAKDSDRNCPLLSTRKPTNLQADSETSRTFKPLILVNHVLSSSAIVRI